MVLLERLLPVALVVSAAGFACSDKASGTIRVELGEEADALSRAPTPTTLVVASVDLDRNVKELARSPLPASRIDLGDQPKTDVGAIRITGLLPDGSTVLRGESLYVQLGALEVAELPVFVQRTGELARMPRAPSGDVSLATTSAGRYVLTTQGTTATIYDLLQLRTITSLPQLPRTPKSLVTYGSTVLVVDDTGATSLDLNTGATAELSAPQGGTFAEVAGGLTVFANDGSQFVVGATRRDGGPTARILRLAADGNLSFAALGTPRLGACASWIEGRGLVVWGGSSTGPGGELLAAGATGSAALAHPADATAGCGLATLDANRVVVAGGGAKTREIDLACAGGCTAREWPGDVPLVRAQGFGLGANAALFVGDDAAGASHVVRVTATETREIPTRIPRRGAKLVASPTGAAVVVGGGAGIEQYLE